MQTDGFVASTPNASTTSLDSFVFTLDPKDKYVPVGVRRAASTSAVQKRSRMQRAAGTDGELWLKHSGGADNASSNEDEGRIMRKRPAAQSLFNKLRRTKSAESTLKAGAELRTGTSWSRKLFSRSSQLMKGKPTNDDVPDVPKLPDNVSSMAPLSLSRPSPSPMQKPPTQRQHELHSPRKPVSVADGVPLPTPELRSLEQIRSTPAPSAMKDGDPEHRPKSSRGSLGSPSTGIFASPEPKQLRNSSSRNMEPLNQSIRDSGYCSGESPKPPDDGVVPTTTATPQMEEYDDSIRLPAHHSTSAHNADEPTFAYAESSAFSYATSDIFSPCLASNTTASGNMSPMYLSQPETPQMSVFGNDAMAWPYNPDLNVEPEYPLHSDDQSWPRPPSQAPPPPPLPSGNQAEAAGLGFQGYSLPSQAQASNVTIKTLPNLDLNDADRGLGHGASKQHLIQSWDDGSGHRMSALAELIDDLGYLGELIN